MSTLEVIIQGIIQGLTEFLPVSSSGHLSVYQHLTGNSGEDALLFSVILHFGTLVAVFIAFWSTIKDLFIEFIALVKDIFHGKFKWSEMNGDRRVIFMLVISCALLLPFYVFKDFFEGINQDNDILVEGLCFLYTSMILYFSDKRKKGHKEFKDIKVSDAVRVGVFQGVALLPGVSRSGSTIAGGLFSNFSRETAVKYSFILGIPTIFAGCLTEVKDAVSSGVAGANIGQYVLGFIISAVVGICAIKMVNWLVSSEKFKVFAYYTLVLGIIVSVMGIIEHISGSNIVDLIKK